MIQFRENGGDINEGEFIRLKYLELDAVQIEHWNAYYTPFPSLERLVLRSCQHFQIPSSFGKISTLQKIEVLGCTKSVERSAFQVNVETLGLGNDAFEVIVSSSGSYGKVGKYSISFCSYI